MIPIRAGTRADGFSLIELMIVLGLVAVVTGAAIPSIMSGMRRYSLISASQQVVSTIRAARHQAVGRNATLRVRFDCPADNQYRIVEVTEDAGIDADVNRCDYASYPFPAGDSDPATLPNLDGAVQYLPQGANFSAVSGDIQITPSGRMTTAETIVVSNEDGQSRTITVSASGRVQLP